MTGIIVPESNSNLVIYNSNPNIVWTCNTTATISANTGIYFSSATTSTATSGFNIIRVQNTDGNFIYPCSSNISTTGGYFTLEASTSRIIIYNGSNIKEDEINRAKYLKQQALNRSAAVHRAKGAIKRALKLMDNVGFGDNIKIFLGGDDIEVSHPDSIFKFLLSRKAGGVIDKTISPGYSTPYHLELYTKTDVHVADLCVYLENTPILDMVLGTAMFIKSGNEDMILSKANWFNVNKQLKELEVTQDIIDCYPGFNKKMKFDRISLNN